jgi:hypothetical protein
MDTFPDVPRVAYATVRNQIRSGDLLLCSGSSVFARLIQHGTDSPWSHVGFVMRLEALARIVVIESVESIGVRIVPLRSYVAAYNGGPRGYAGRLFLARHQAFATMPPEVLHRLSQSSIDLLGYPYDPQTILAIAARVVARKLGMEPRPFERNHAFICSELVWECFHAIGIDMPTSAANFVAPCNFATCPEVQILWELAVESSTAEVTPNGNPEPEWP